MFKDNPHHRQLEAKEVDTGQPADPLTGAQREKLDTPAYDLVPFEELYGGIEQIKEAGLTCKGDVKTLLYAVTYYIRGAHYETATPAFILQCAAALINGGECKSHNFPTRKVVEAFARVSEVGAIKYAPWNWTKGLKRTQLCGSLWRHATALQGGEEYDLVENGGTGLLHAEHVLWNALALYHSHYHGILDDRRTEPPRDYTALK